MPTLAPLPQAFCALTNDQAVNRQLDAHLRPSRHG
jgi:hypothetical protein